MKTKKGIIRKIRKQGHRSLVIVIPKSMNLKAGDHVEVSKIEIIKKKDSKDMKDAKTSEQQH